MLYFNPIEIDDIDSFSKIIKKKNLKRRAILTRVYHQIVTRYGKYTHLFENLDKIQSLSWSDEEAEALRHCYSSSTEAFNKVKKEIKKNSHTHTKHICPYCGIGECSTLDHYAPKTVWPEFSVYSKNLIYVCFSCNRIKSSLFASDKERIFVNPFFDSPPDYKYLKATILNAYNRNYVKYTLELKEDDERSATIYNHYDKLNLLPNLSDSPA
jgi:hypothetical protein